MYWTIILGLATAACASSTPAGQSSPAAACPLGLIGTVVTFEDTELGVALTFVAPRDQLPELRARARRAAEMRGPGAHDGLGHEGHHAEGGHHGLRALLLPPVQASVRDVDAGARIDLVPDDPQDRATLVAKARQSAERMNTLACG